MNIIIDNIKNWWSNEASQKRLVSISIVVIFVLILILNYLFPLFLDDRYHSVVKFGESVQFPQSFIDIYDFHIFYYFAWGGRIVAHVIAHLLLMLPPIAQDMLNTAIFVSLIYLLYRFANRKRTENILVLLFIGLLIFYFTPRFSSDVLWITGSANYLWTTFIIIALAYYFYQYSDGRKYKDTWMRAIAFLLFGILAGWTNENMGPTLCLILIAYLLYYKKNAIAIPKWTITSIVGVIIGCALLILAPGNKERTIVEGFNTDYLHSISGIFGKLNNMLSYYYKEFILLFTILFIICFLLYWHTNKKTEHKGSILFNALLFFIAGEVAFWITVLSPSFPLRAFGGIVIFKVLSIGILYANIQFKSIRLQLLNVSVISILLLLSTIEYVRAYNAFALLHTVTKEREQTILELKEKGIREVEFPYIIKVDYKYEYMEVEAYWEQYYQMDKVTFKQIDRKEYLETNAK